MRCDSYTKKKAESTGIHCLNCPPTDQHLSPPFGCSFFTAETKSRPFIAYGIKKNTITARRKRGDKSSPPFFSTINIQNLYAAMINVKKKPAKELLFLPHRYLSAGFAYGYDTQNTYIFYPCSA